MPKPTRFVKLSFPFNGISTSRSFSEQDTGQGGDVTCVSAQNVRGIDPTQNRLRGSQRAGYSKYLPGTISGSVAISGQINTAADDGCWNPGTSTFDSASNVIDLQNATQAGAGVFSAQINATADDGYFYDTRGGGAFTTYNNSAATVQLYNLAAAEQDTGFFHFPNVTIPAGATISAASLTVRPTTTISAAPDLPQFSLYGEKGANPAAVASQADGSSRALTANTTTWNPGSWVSGVDIQTIDMTAVVQEIVNLGGWASGNAIQLFMKWVGTQGAGAFHDVLIVGDDGTHPAGRATLTINYSPVVVHKIGFLHFPTVSVPAGATVQSASLTIRSNNTETTTLTVSAEKAANPVAVASAADGDSRAGTTNRVTWAGAFTGGVNAASPDLTAIVQELVNQGGWASGNAMQFFLQNASVFNGSGSAALNVVADDGTHPAGRCSLSIAYGTGGNAGAIQCINHVVVPVSSGLASASVRQVKAVAAAGGTVATFSRGGVFTTVSGGGAALNANTPYIATCTMLGKVYFADGLTWKYYDPSLNSMVTMTASAGALPTDASNNAPRLIAAWRNRLVWSGLLGDSQNIFASRQGAPLDYNYNISPADAQQAWALNVINSTEAGYSPDVVNALCAYNDDLLLVFGDHTVAQITGDPAAGGQIDVLSHVVGSAFGEAWCRDDRGNVWFLGSRGALYVLHPYSHSGGNNPPKRVSSERIDEQLMTLDLSQSLVRLAWDNRFETVMIYITPLAGGASTMYAYDVRQNAFWQDTFVNNNMNATAVHLMDGDNVLDRMPLIGCFDGRIRNIDVAATSDDGQAIQSKVWFGPLTFEMGRMWLKEIRAVLGSASGNVTITVYTGPSPEAAFVSGTARWSDTLTAGKNRAKHPLCKAQAMYIVLSNVTINQTWQFEQMVVDLQATGKVASRVF